MCPFICTVTKIQGPKSQMNITKCSIAWRTTSCTKCVKLYISETGHTLDTRFKEHLADITDLNRIQVLADVKHHRDKTVTNHFNQAGHSIHNVRVLGLWLLFKDNTNDRKDMESHLIDKLGTRKPEVMNERPYWPTSRAVPPAVFNFFLNILLIQWFTPCELNCRDLAEGFSALFVCFWSPVQWA